MAGIANRISASELKSSPHPLLLPRGLGAEIDVGLHAHREWARIRDINNNFGHVDVAHLVALWSLSAQATGTDVVRNRAHAALELAIGKRIGAHDGTLADA